MKYSYLFVLFGLFLATAQTAEARVFVGGGVVVGAPYYYYPPYYAYYPPPPPYGYYAAPVYAPPAYAPPPPTANDRFYTSPGERYCREYHHTVMVAGQRQQAVGHACRQPDGQWEIMD